MTTASNDLSTVENKRLKQVSENSISKASTPETGKITAGIYKNIHYTLKGTVLQLTGIVCRFLLFAKKQFGTILYNRFFS